MPRAGKAFSATTSFLALMVAAMLTVFNARRLVFLVAAALDLVERWFSGARTAGNVNDLLPDVLVLSSMRNESASLPDLADSLLALDYPADRLTIGLIDDASTDGSSASMDALSDAHGQIHTLHNPVSLGKADSLNAGLARWPAGEIVAVYDADARPVPDSLRQIAAAFADQSVAAAGGLIRPANGLASLTASYAAVERLVHQQVTMRAKDRLNLTPAILGSNCAYRRSDLAAAGGFPGGAFLEDSHLTLTFARQGRRTRFLPEAVAGDQVPETLSGYWRQHVRWGRGFVDVAAGGRDARSNGRRLKPAPDTAKHAEASSERRLSAVQRVELTLFSLGYLDRLTLMAGLGLAMFQRAAGIGARTNRVLAAALLLNVALPYGQIAAALAAERATLAWWIRLPVLPAFFIVDAAAAIWSTALSISRQPRTWQQTERTLPVS